MVPFPDLLCWEGIIMMLVGQTVLTERLRISRTVPCLPPIWPYRILLATHSEVLLGLVYTMEVALAGER